MTASPPSEPPRTPGAVPGGPGDSDASDVPHADTSRKVPSGLEEDGHLVKSASDIPAETDDVNEKDPVDFWQQAGEQPERDADGRVHRRFRKVMLRTLSKTWGDSLFGMSSQAAFWCALSTAPLLLALLGLVGPFARLFGPGTLNQIDHQIDKFLHSVFNEEVASNLLGDTVATILRHSQSGAISVGLVISFWAGSSAMSAFVEAITIAYGQHEVRHPFRERFFALGLYLIALFSGILLLPILAIGPSYLPNLFPTSWRDDVATIVGFSYYPVLAILIILLMTTFYKVAPKHRHPWLRGLPGALLAAAIFLVASVGLRIYLSYVYSHGLTYGALATPITFLLFYYFASMAIIIGAQFNNALLEYYPVKSKTTRSAALA